jgi:hypothetical protein
VANTNEFFITLSDKEKDSILVDSKIHFLL